MKVGRNSPCWCGSGAKLKRCHLHRDVLRRPAVHLGHVGALRSVPAAIARPPYALDPPTWPMPEPQILSGAALERMRHAGRVAAEVLAETVAAVADRVVMLAHGVIVADVPAASLAPGELEALFLERMAAERDRLG